MKILHVIITLSQKYGGPVKYCKTLCHSQAMAGEDVTIYTTNMDYPSGELNVALNQQVIQDGYALWYFPVQFKPYFVSMDLYKALKHNLKKFDIVHIHGLYRFPLAAAAYYCRKYNLPYIVRPHGSLDPYLYNKNSKKVRKRLYEFFIENRNLNKASAIQYSTINEMLLAKPLGINSKYFISPNSINHSKYDKLPAKGYFREKYNLNNNQKIIIHFGRINFVKGLDILVKAFAKTLKEFEDIILVLAGPDNEGFRTQVEKWINKEGISEKIIFTGMLRGDASLELLSDADIFALPSYTESFGMAVAEAMACGLPVVISDKVNIYRDVLEAKAGIVTKCDADEVSDAFINLLGDDNKRLNFGKAGINLVKEKYDPNNITSNIINIYQDLVDAKN